VAVRGLVAVIVTMRASVEALELALEVAFADIPDARIVEDIPGLGMVLGARILAEIGDDPTRFSTASGLRSFAGTALITRPLPDAKMRVGVQCGGASKWPVVLGGRWFLLSWVRWRVGSVQRRSRVGGAD
jgi:transposase